MGSEERMTGRELSMDFTSAQHKYTHTSKYLMQLVLLTHFNQRKPEQKQEVLILTLLAMAWLRRLVVRMFVMVWSHCRVKWLSSHHW